jgi:uncharacterized protein YjbI with pentapeptide repeats
MQTSFPQVVNHDRLDFTHQDLQGRSFRGQNLTGAIFTGADIRSADFAAAQLVGADFTQVTAGLNRPWWWLMVVTIVLLAGLAGAGCSIACVITMRLLHPEYIAHRSLLPGITTLIVVPLFMLGVIRWGLTTQLATLAAALAGSFIIGQALLCIALGSEGLNRGQETGWRLAGVWSWAFMGVLFGALSLTAGWQLLRHRSRYLVLPWMVGVGLALYGSWDLNQHAKQFDATVLGNLEAWPWVIPPAIVLGGLSVYVSWWGRQEADRFQPIAHLATFLCTIGGTQFQGANLTRANLQAGNFAQTNFTQAKLTQTNFYLARKVHQARLAGTILQQRSVRDLLTSHRGAGRSYVGCDLRGAYLVEAVLADADFTDANWQNANLSGAWLDRANLTRVQAIGADLRNCHLTAACLEAWNIDQTTQLTGIDCEFVYLLHQQQERSPSSGMFAAGEFTKLFQQAIDTVDLIIRNGVDWQSLTQTIKQLQVEQGDTPLTVRSIENKGDGMVIVKVAVAPETDKAQFYESFQATYAATLQSLEAKHQATIAAKDAQIELYREQQNDLKQITQLLAAGNPGRSVKSITPQCVVLKLNTGSLTTGFTTTLQIGPEATTPHVEVTGHLAPAPELWAAYQDWRQAYQRSLNANHRMHIPDTQITNISRRDFWQNCETKAAVLADRLNQWLNHPTSRPLKERLLEQLSPTDPIRLLVQTDDADLRHLPLQLWDWFDRYPQAELALSTPSYQRIQPSVKPKSQVKILAILGDSQGIDIAHDRALLEQLPNAAITFLVEPDRRELTDRLWEQDWDILFFAGHSQSRQVGNAECGYLQINAQEQLPIGQLRHGLRKAIAQGLQLAIFNSCDGLGIARELADLDLPQMIVMREPVPDRVAQEFLKHFLLEFSRGTSLYQSVRRGREQLQGLEDQFPCASWLPVIYQNPAIVPMLWADLTHGDKSL